MVLSKKSGHLAYLVDSSESREKKDQDEHLNSAGKAVSVRWREAMCSHQGAEQGLFPKVW